MKLEKIKDVNGYMKDTQTGAVLSVDNNALVAYKKNRATKQNLTNEVTSLKKDMVEMRVLLEKLLNK